MTRNIRQWQRNTDGLRSNAQKKAAATAQRAEAAIRSEERRVGKECVSTC